MEHPRKSAQSVCAAMPQGFWANYYLKKSQAFPRGAAGEKLDRAWWVGARGSHARPVDVRQAPGQVLG